MAPKRTARYVEVRARLRFHEDLDTGLYELISNTPEGLRGELLHALLTRAAPTMGLQTRVPLPTPLQAPPHPVASASQLAAGVRESRQSVAAPASDGDVPEKAGRATAGTDKPLVGIEALGIKSMADWNDAFDYSTPPS